MLLLGVFLAGLVFGAVGMLLVPCQSKELSPLTEYEVDGHLRTAWLSLEEQPELALRHAERAVQKMKAK